MMQTIVLRGTPGARGEQLGRAFADRIRHHVAQWTWEPGFRHFYDANEERTEWGPPPANEELMGRCAVLMWAMEAQVPATMDWLRGIARGAEVPFARVFAMSCGRALWAARVADVWAASGCTAWHVETEDLGPVIAGTSDSGRFPDQPIRVPPGGPPSPDQVLCATVTECGMHVLEVAKLATFQCSGTNECGIVHGGNNLPYGPMPQTAGVPYGQAWTQVCWTAESVDDVESHFRRITQVSRAKNSIVLDGQGTVRSLEKCYDRLGTLGPNGEGILAHANDYQSEAMTDLYERNANSAHRVATVLELIRQRRQSGEPVTAVWIREEMCRHHRTVGSLCRHGEQSLADDLGTTAGAYLWAPLAPGGPQWWRLRGRPCREAWESVPVIFATQARTQGVYAARRA